MANCNLPNTIEKRNVAGGLPSHKKSYITKKIMPIKFRKNIRLKKYDYDTNGYYFVTIVTHNRLPLLKSCKDAIEISIKKLPEFINGLDAAGLPSDLSNSAQKSEKSLILLVKE
ncbi:hypothetical protein HY745_09315 [Candidatus Desantisbacteria bacterium]|nr:hypothetical protein [Candidatus Desantisbacteria bacterium]